MSIADVVVELKTGSDMALDCGTRVTYLFAHNVMLLASMYLGLSAITKDCSRHTSLEPPKPVLLNFGNLVSHRSLNV